ncbi:MAG: DUF5131 family protein [Methylococcaceae bacterium]
MATNIPYVDEVWNPVCGCTKCSPGCENCWAEKMAMRLAAIEYHKLKNHLTPHLVENRIKKYMRVVKKGWKGNVYCDEKALNKPLHWRNPRKILTCSMADYLHPKVPDDFIYKMFDIAYRCPQHDFWFLTKRIERLAEKFTNPLPPLEKKPFPGVLGLWNAVPWPLPNVHLGVTICNQKEADEKIPILLSIPAAHRWISVEPMLEPVDLKQVDFWDEDAHWIADTLTGHAECINSISPSGVVDDAAKLDQVIIGCESGPNRRPIARKHIKDLYEQCNDADVDVMVKQMAENEDGTGKVIHDLAWIKRMLGD